MYYKGREHKIRAKKNKTATLSSPWMWFNEIYRETLLRAYHFCARMHTPTQAHIPHTHARTYTVIIYVRLCCLMIQKERQRGSVLPSMSHYSCHTSSSSSLNTHHVSASLTGMRCLDIPACRGRISRKIKIIIYRRLILCAA